MINNKSRTLYFDLDISKEQFLQYYQGDVSYVMVTTSDNMTVQFPAHFIRKFVSHTGIKGRFRIIYDENNKLVSISKVPSQ